MPEVVRKAIWLIFFLVAISLVVASAFTDVSEYSLIFAGIFGAIFGLTLPERDRHDPQSGPESDPLYAPCKAQKSRRKVRFGR